MRRFFVLLFACLVTLGASAQVFLSASSELEKKAAETGKGVLASQLDSTLPHEGLDAWLQRTFGAVPLWTGDDCGLFGSAPVRAFGDPSLCAHASLSFEDGSRVDVQVVVGSYKQGIQGAPRLAYSTFTGPDGDSVPFTELHELPELARAPRQQPVALLLGIRLSREGMSQEEQQQLRSDYQTILIARTASHGWQVAQSSELLVPHSGAWWLVGTVSSEIQVELTVQPDEHYSSQQAETKVWIRRKDAYSPKPVATAEEATGQDGSDARQITFVSERYLAVDEFMSGIGAHYDESWGSYVASLDKPETSLQLSKLVGPSALQKAEKAAAGVGPDADWHCDGASADDSNWLIARHQGLWYVEPRLQTTGAGICGRFAELVDLLPAPSVVVGWNELPIPWAELAKLGADDAFFSPARDFIILKMGDKLSVRPVTAAARVQVGAPIAEFPIPAGATVMTLWQQGAGVRDWLAAVGAR